MEVVPISAPHTCDDLVKGLRTLADDIEAGKIDLDTQPNLAVVVLGYETARRDRDGTLYRCGHTIHGFGEKCTVLTARGLLATALADRD
jgi:hypothetical protein